MTFSVYGLTLGMDLDKARNLLESTGFVVNTLENKFFSNCLVGVKEDYSIVLFSGLVRQVALIASFLTEERKNYDALDKLILNNTYHLVELQNLIGVDGLYRAQDSIRDKISPQYKYTIKEAILNNKNQVLLLMIDDSQLGKIRWGHLIMSKEPMGFYDFDYTPIKDHIEQHPSGQLETAYRLLNITHYFSIGCNEI